MQFKCTADAPQMHRRSAKRRRGERKEREEEETTPTTARARACMCKSLAERLRNPSAALGREELSTIAHNRTACQGCRELVTEYTQTIPSVERAIKHAALHELGDESFVREWYDTMESSGWRNSRGMETQNWCSSLKKWAKVESEAKAKSAAGGGESAADGRRSVERAPYRGVRFRTYEEQLAAEAEERNRIAREKALEVMKNVSVFN